MKCFQSQSSSSRCEIFPKRGSSCRHVMLICGRTFQFAIKVVWKLDTLDANTEMPLTYNIAILSSGKANCYLKVNDLQSKNIHLILDRAKLCFKVNDVWPRKILTRHVFLNILMLPTSKIKLNHLLYVDTEINDPLGKNMFKSWIRWFCAILRL